MEWYIKEEEIGYEITKSGKHLNVEKLASDTEKNRLKWFGHLKRMEKGRQPQKIIKTYHPCDGSEHFEHTRCTDQASTCVLQMTLTHWSHLMWILKCQKHCHG